MPLKYDIEKGLWYELSESAQNTYLHLEILKTFMLNFKR